MALSDSAIELDASFPAQPTQVAAIRRAVCDLAAQCGADAHTLTRLGLAVSEAATNVVLHAYRSSATSGAIDVSASAASGGFDVCVRDHGVGMSPRSDSPGLGLGLALMASECDRFEVRCADDGGTEVLLRFELPTRPRPTSKPRFARDVSGTPARATV